MSGGDAWIRVLKVIHPCHSVLLLTAGVCGSSGRNEKLNVTTPLPPSFMYIDVNTLDMDTQIRLGLVPGSFRSRATGLVPNSAAHVAGEGGTRSLIEKKQQARSGCSVGSLVATEACDKT